MATPANETIASINAFLKETYTGKDKIMSTIYKTSAFIGLVKKDPNLGGEDFKWPVRVANTQTRSSDFKMGLDRAKANKVDFVAWKVTSDQDYSHYVVPTKHMKITRTMSQSFYKRLLIEMESAKEQLLMNRSYTMYADGVGYIGQVKAAVSAAKVFVLKDAKHSINFEVGKKLQIIGGKFAATVGNNRTATITAVSARKTSGDVSITVDTNLTIGINDFIFVEGDVPGAIGQRTFFPGLSAQVGATIASTGDSLYGVNRYKDVTRLSGSVLARGTTDWRDTFVNACTQVLNAGGDISHFIVPPDVYGAVSIELGAQVRYVRESRNYRDIGDISFQGIQIHVGNRKGKASLFLRPVGLSFRSVRYQSEMLDSVVCRNLYSSI